MTRLHGGDRVAPPRRGQLQLDDPAAMHVPELQGQRPPVADAPSITIRRLLSMSAGFPGDDPWGDRQQDLDRDAFSEFLEGGQSFAFMRDGVRVLEPRVRDPRAHHHERHRTGISRRRSVAGAGTAGHDLDQIRSSSVSGRAARDRIRPARRRVRRGAVRRIRSVRIDGRPVQHRAGPRAMGRRVRPRVRTSRGRRTSVVACVSLGDAAGPTDDRSGADVDLRRRAPDSDGDGLQGSERSSDPTWSSERSSRTAAATRGSARTCGGIPPPAWASWCWETGRTSCAQDRRSDAAGIGSRRELPDPSPDARARARGRARRGRASARGMGRRPGGGHVLDERRHGRTARATPRGVRSSRDARTVASLR